jgi:hypothetical protein
MTALQGRSALRVAVSLFISLLLGGSKPSGLSMSFVEGARRHGEDRPRRREHQ